MNILQINTIYKLASTGRTTFELDNYLKKTGHNSFVAASTDIETKGSYYKIGGELGKKVHALLSRASGLQGYFSSFSTLQLINYIKKNNIDIVHLRVVHSNYLNISLLLNFMAKKKIPVVVTLHDCFFYTGKCCHYTVDGCYKWQSECGDCIRWKRDNKSWFFDRTRKMFRDKRKSFSKIDRLAVIGVSKWIAGEAKKAVIFKDATIIKHIYNWVDLSIFKPINDDALRVRLKLENKFVILGVASGWSEVKGLGAFLEISEKLDESFQIILIGDMPDKSSLPKNILSVSKTDDVSELVRYYSMADCFLNLSLEETFGKVTAEALACGTPAIVPNSTASPELIGDNCGYVAGKNSTDEIIEKIMLIRKNEKEYYSDSCRSFACENFDADKNSAEYLELYNSLYKK